MSFLESNLRALFRGHPELERQRLEHKPLPAGLQLVDSASGQLTARIGGAYVHSRYDPLREAEQMVSGEASAGIATAVFYGFGLGYQVEAFHRRHPQVPALVIEPDAGLFVETLRHRDLAELLGAGELFWCIGEEPEAVVMILDSLPLGRLGFFRLRPSVTREPQYFRRVDTAIHALLDRREVNLNTLRRFGRLWLRNLLANLPEFAAAPGVGRLEGRFGGIPALVLAAGPSLDEVLPRLAELRERLLLIAVDTSHRLCQEAGVEPDVLVTVDPQYWNTRHLDRVRVEDTVVVSEPSVHPGVLRRLGGEPPLYFVSSFFPLGRLLEEAVGTKGRVGAGGSVATTAWDLGRLLGCRPIFMGGLDLGYPGARTHCRGAFFEEQVHGDAGRLAPAETAHYRVLHDAGPLRLESNDGAQTLTDRRLLIYKWWFENQMSQQEQAAGEREPLLTFSLSGGGIRIRGMAYRSLDTLLELPKSRPSLEPGLSAARLEAREYRRSASERLSAALRTLRELSGSLRTLEQVASRARQACGRLRQDALRSGTRGEGQAQLYRELDELDAAILELSSRNVAGFLFQGLIQRILDCPRADGPPDKILELSEELYAEIAASASYHLGLLDAATGRQRIH
jgi:hypothetical protein